MRQETIVKTYLNFNELNDKQKSKVLDKLRFFNVEHQDWHDFVTEEFTQQLKELGYSNIKTYFSGFSSQGDGACFTATKEGLEIVQSGRYYHEMSMQCESPSLLQEARKLAKQYYKDLEKNYDYLISDEVVIETIEVYEFDSETLNIV